MEDLLDMVWNIVKKTKKSILRRIVHHKKYTRRILMKLAHLILNKKDRKIIPKDDDHDQGFSAVQKTMENPLILKIILENMSTRDLLQSCRGVTSMWNELSAKILIQRQSLQVSFWFCSSRSKVYQKFHVKAHKEEDGDQIRTLENFMECFKHSSHFPCVSFSFSDGSLQGQGQISKFFSLFGQKVKQLHLSGMTGKGHEFRKLLQIQAPHIESLYIEKFPLDWTHNNNNNNNNDDEDNDWKISFQLPNLKSIHFTQPRLFPKIQSEILRAAINLKSYDSLVTASDLEQSLEIFVETGKIGTIQNLQFEPTPGQLWLFEKFSKCSSPKLKTLTFSMRAVLRRPECWPSVAESFSKILESSKDSLQSISLAHPMPVSSELFKLRWPTLTKVREMEIAIYKTLIEDPSNEQEHDGGQGQAQGSLDEDESEWSATFPCLETLVLKPWVNQDRFWEKHLPFTGPAVTVKRLGIYHPCPQFSLDSLAILFPNVSHFFIEGPTDFPTVGRAIWKMSRLERLDLRLDIGYHHCDNIYPSVDATFTGFSDETCRRLKNSSGLQENCDEEVESLRVNPSILDLRELKQLNIEICYWTTIIDRTVYGLSHDRYSLLTNVTGMHAFQKMGQLKVKISAISFYHQNLNKIKKSLASIAPYVSKVDTTTIRPARQLPGHDTMIQILNDFGNFVVENEIVKHFYTGLWICVIFFLLSIR